MRTGETADPCTSRGAFPVAPVCKDLRPNRTKMFHVKHFGKVRPENLTRPKTADPPSIW
jgi:hypothetical protein